MRCVTVLWLRAYKPNLRGYTNEWLNFDWSKPTYWIMVLKKTLPS